MHSYVSVVISHNTELNIGRESYGMLFKVL